MTKQENLYRFTTYNPVGDQVELYHMEAHTAKEVRLYAAKIIGNSRWNETRHSRIEKVTNYIFKTN